MTQYGYRVPVVSEETTNSVYEKVGKFISESCPDVHLSCIAEPTVFYLNTVHTEIKINVAAS